MTPALAAARPPLPIGRDRYSPPPPRRSLAAQRGARAGSPPYRAHRRPAPDEGERQGPDGRERLALRQAATKLVVGAMNCRKPMTDNGTRRAAQENSTSGKRP